MVDEEPARFQEPIVLPEIFEVPVDASAIPIEIPRFVLLVQMILPVPVAEPIVFPLKFPILVLLVEAEDELYIPQNTPGTVVAPLELDKL